EEVLMLGYLVASYRQDAAHLRRIAEEAAANPQPDAVTRLVLGLIVSLNGNLRAACDLLAEAQAASERSGDFALALTALFHQCRLHVFAGNLQQAHELSQQALRHVQDLGGALLP